MSSRTTAIKIARLADEMKAEDIRILSVKKICNFTDYFLIATCNSGLQLRGLGHRIERQLRDEGTRPFSSAGYDTTSWVVIDYGDTIVHLFTPEARQYYRLDTLWQDAPALEWKKSAAS